MPLTKSLRRLSSFDAFPKIDSTYTNQTFLGGLASISISFILAWLFIKEFSAYRSLDINYQFLVDTSTPKPQNLGWVGTSSFGVQEPIRQGGIMLNLDMTVAMPCLGLSVDLVDAGDVSVDIKQFIQFEKVEFDITGVKEYKEPTGPAKAIHIENIITDAKAPIADVSIPSTSSSSPSSSALSNPEKENAVDNSACRLHGNMMVNKVKGKLEINSMGQSILGLLFNFGATNFTHRIDKFSFGVDLPGLVNPLERSYQASNSTFQMYNYYVNIIPTIFEDSSNNILVTNQYGVTENKREIDHDKGSHGTPGIFIKYDVEPLILKITEYHRSFRVFFTRVCGIIGGVFVCAGILHSIISNIAMSFLSLFRSEKAPKSKSRRSGKNSQVIEEYSKLNAVG